MKGIHYAYSHIDDGVRGKPTSAGVRMYDLRDVLLLPRCAAETRPNPYIRRRRFLRCRHHSNATWWRWSVEKVKKVKKVNFEIYIADRKLLPLYRQSFFCSAVLTPQHYHGTLLHDSPSRRVASWVNYSSRRTESSSEHFAIDLSLLKADAPWCENKRCSDSNPW